MNLFRISYFEFRIYARYASHSTLHHSPINHSQSYEHPASRIEPRAMTHAPRATTHSSPLPPLKNHFYSHRPQRPIIFKLLAKCSTLSLRSTRHDSRATSHDSRSTRNYSRTTHHNSRSLRATTHAPCATTHSSPLPPTNKSLPPSHTATSDNIYASLSHLN